MYYGDFGKAHQFFDQLITSRERIYGEGSFNLLKPTETVAQILRLQNAQNECQVIIDQCLKMIANLLGEPSPVVVEAEEPKTEEVKDEEVEEEVKVEERDLIKNPNQLLIIYQTRIELYYMQQRMEYQSRLFNESLVTIDKLIGFQRHILTLEISQKVPERTELANLLYLKG